MNNYPIGFGAQQYMDYFNLQPSVVKGTANTQTEVEKRYLYTKLASVFDFKLPVHWAKNWFRFWVFRCGSIAVLYTKKFGWVCQPWGFSKLDLQYQPSVIQVYNAHFNDVKTGVIGVNAEIIKCMDDYFGLDDLVTKYAVMLSDINKDFNINLMNSNLSLVYMAENKKDADAIKEAYGDATTGKPMVTVQKRLLENKPLEPLIGNVKQTYIGNELLVARRTVMNMFLTEIGILNTNMEKRAQMSDDEVQAGQEETQAVCSVMLENLRESIARVNRLSGLGISVKLRYGRELYEDNTLGYV